MLGGIIKGIFGDDDDDDVKPSKEFTNLDNALAGINKKLQAEYERYGHESQDRLFQEYQNRDTTDQAQKDAIKARRMLGEIDERNQSRYGVAPGSPGEAQYDMRTSALTGVRSGAGAVNTARLGDEDTRLGDMQSLMSHGTTLRNAAQGGMGAAVQNAARRDQANWQIGTQQRGNQLNLGGSLIGAAGSIIGSFF